MRIFITCMFIASVGWGFDLNLHGNYKFEGTTISQSEKSKAYLIHNLTLNPQIIAADDVYIHARLDIFNNDYLGYLGGDFLGGKRGGGYQYQIPSGVNANLAYISWTIEHGNLMLGRIPLDFGLGLNLSSRGRHYIDNMDGVAFKAVMGNFAITPAYGIVKTDKTKIHSSEYMGSAIYENPEILFGALYHKRIGHVDGTELDGIYGTDGFTSKGKVNIRSLNFHAEKSISKFKIRTEIGTQTGDTGIGAENGNELKIDSFGLVAKVSSDEVIDTIEIGLNMGYISGDDPQTADVYEGYLVDRDYDVGLILFNQVLRQNILGTHKLLTNEGLELNNAADFEFLTNAFYLSPEVKFPVAEKVDLKASIIWARVLQNTSNNFEIDVTTSYNITDEASFSLDLGYLFPSSARPDRAMIAQAYLAIDF